MTSVDLFVKNDISVLNRSFDSTPDSEGFDSVQITSGDTVINLFFSDKSLLEQFKAAING